jgi:fatty acid synthase
MIGINFYIPYAFAHDSVMQFNAVDFSASQHTGMEIFLKETSFHGIMLDYLLFSTSEKKKVLHDIVSEGIKSGAVKPLVRNVFAQDEAEQAFRYKEHSYLMVCCLFET